ncbi:unnamed protein product [Blumeria hordei]|uniref:Uncharacterized protein n=1 Tax=Blumeria hordei TaxID=2867405 RepID=A0A383ULZ1_BLUHO|nr:unnamed protein product [Blumeria hordei]
MQRIHSFLILILFSIVFAADVNIDYMCSTKVTFDGWKIQSKLSQMNGYYHTTLLQCKHRGPCIRKNLLKLVWQIRKFKREPNAQVPDGTLELCLPLKTVEEGRNRTPRKNRITYQIVARCSGSIPCQEIHVTEKAPGKKSPEIICSKM